MYVPLSSGPSSSVTRSPELLSLILGLSGETVYPLDTGGAKFGMLCGLEPLNDTEPKDVKSRSVKIQRTYALTCYTDCSSSRVSSSPRVTWCTVVHPNVTIADILDSKSGACFTR